MSPTQHRRSEQPSTPALQISMNNLAKRVKRAAFGMTNFRHWRVRVLLYAGKPNWDLLPDLTPLAS